MLLGAAGQNPVDALRAAASDRELDTAGDRAAVLDWRLDASGLRNAARRPAAVDARHPGPSGRGPALGRLPDPARRTWSSELADQVHHDATSRPGRTLPAGRRTGCDPRPTTIGDVEVWRAAMQVPVDDRRPTGAPQLQKASATLAATPQPAP